MPLSTGQVPGVTGVGTVPAGPHLPASGTGSSCLYSPGWAWHVLDGPERVPTALPPARSHLEGVPRMPGRKRGPGVGPGKQRACPGAPRSLPRPGSPSCRPDPSRASSLRAAVPALGPRPRWAEGRPGSRLRGQRGCHLSSLTCGPLALPPPYVCVLPRLEKLWPIKNKASPAGTDVFTTHG